MVRLLPLSQRLSAAVDDEDYERLSRYKWYLVVIDGRYEYAQRTEIVGGRRRLIYLHREVLGAPPGALVDHRNGDGLDCRRGNLRLASAAQNQQNLTRLRKDSSTGVRGVTWDKRKRKYAAQIQHRGRHLHLGYFATLTKAAEAAQAGRRRLFTHAPEAD